MADKPGNNRIGAQTVSDKLTPIIIRKDDGFCVYLQEWNIGGDGETLEEAYGQYEQNKKSFEARTDKFGLDKINPEPFPSLKRGALLRDLTLYSTKAALASFAVILVVIILLPNIGSAVSHQLTSLLNIVIRPEFQKPRYWAIELPTKLNAQLDRLNPDEEAKMASEWNKFFMRADPILGPLLRTPQNRAKPKPQ